MTVTNRYVYGGIGGRISKLTTTVEGEIFEQTIGWTDLGGIASIGYPDLDGFSEPARQVTYGYSNGYLTSVPGYANNINYYDNGAPLLIVHTNGVTDHHGRDPNWMRRTRRIRAKKDGADVWDTGYFASDGAGNITQMGIDSFVYDKVSRLLSGSAIGGTETQSYTYDGFGNIIEIDDSQGTRTITVDTPTNRLSSPATYDAAGNLTSWGGFTYQWRPTGELRSRTGTGLNKWFAYDADGERVVIRDELTDTTTYTLRGLNGKVLRVFEKADDVWSWKKDYVCSQDKQLAMVDSSGTQHFSLDHLGTIRYVSDSSGNEVIEHAYYGFGEKASAVWDNEPMKFTGHERDLEGTTDAIDDLDYMHARYYNPYIGRFLSVDPVGGETTSSQTWNRYSYVRDNPLNFVDPTGEIGKEIADWISHRVEEAIDWYAENVSDETFLGSTVNDASVVAGALVEGIGDLLRLGDSTGQAIGEGASGEDFILALSQDIGRASGLALMMALPANSAVQTQSGVAVGKGTTVYRVWGDKAGPYGRSWSTVDPGKIANYRNAAGLPLQNSGRFVSQGIIRDAGGVATRSSRPLHGNLGGLPEVVIPNPATQVRLIRVSGANPPF